jgi:imidazole glycerol-phosphate synthase subunit HisH
LTVVLDYGMGNLGSVVRAVRHLGFECSVQPDLAGAAKLIVPGVGAFGAAMERIAPLRGAIRRFVEAGKPLMGICLGQQLLFERSEELGVHEGLGLLRGTVVYLPSKPGLKVPHIGWNELRWARPDGLAQGMQDGEQAYFVHSLVTECEDPADVAAWTTYGAPFASAVMRDNVWGAQFHPEKSGQVGLRILRNFLEC